MPLLKGEKIGCDKKAVEIARKMLQDGLSVEVVSKYSGLSFEEVEKLS